MNNIVYYKWPIDYYNYTFSLGEDYVVRCNNPRNAEMICKFIKVTPKGFNLLNLNTNRCILRKHLYDNRYSGKYIPNNDTTFKVKVSAYFNITKLRKERMA